MKYKILLLAPPVFDFYFTPARREPLGLLYIKTEVQRKFPWLQVDIYDARASGKSKKQTWPEYLAYLKHIYVPDESPFSLLQRFYRFGDSFEKIYQKIKDQDYSLIAISSLFSAYHPDVESLIGYLKQRLNSYIAVGGWAVWGQEFAHEQGRADFYISRDSLTELIQQLFLADKKWPDKKINSSFKENASCFLDIIPSREKLPMYKGKKIASLITSKGCMYQCSFCSIHRRYRFTRRSLQSIDQELKYLLRFGAEIVNFEDDNLLYPTDYALEFLQILKKYNRQGLSFCAMNGIYAQNLYNVIDEALEAGFMEWNFSLVSTVKKTLQEQNRSHQQKNIEKILTKIQQKTKNFVPVVVFLIAGLPHSSHAALIADILFLAQLPVSIGFSPLYLLPGVPELEKMGLPDQNGLLRSSAMYKFGSSFEGPNARENIASIWKFTRMINYLKQPDKNDPKLHPTLTQSLHFFAKSLAKKTWYAKHKGEWQPTFTFDVTLPDRLDIVDTSGKKTTWHFHEFLNESFGKTLPPNIPIIF